MQPLSISAQTIIYVDSSAQGLNTGTSWQNAFTNLQSALGVADSTRQIWIAKGTYFPTTTTNRYLTFNLKNKVSIYGGFAGNETALSQRNTQLNPTILSGDIGVRGDTSDNTEHIVSAYNVYYPTTLDGLIFEYGHATLDSAAFTLSQGGAINLTYSAVTISNCLFRYNYANAGGAISTDDSYADIENCTFYSNNGQQAACVYGYYCYAMIRNCTFTENSVLDQYGHGTAGAISIDATDIYNCTFKKNHAKTAAGAIFMGGGTNLYNCIFDSNYCESQGGALYYESGIADAYIYNCRFTNNYASDVKGSGGAIYFTDGHYMGDLDNCLFANNHCGNEGGALYISWTNLRIANCIFNNNISHNRGGAIVFYSGQESLWINNSTFVKNQADSVGQVFYDYNIWYRPTKLNNCIFANNGTPEIQDHAGSLHTWRYHCITQTPDTGAGNILTPPLFVDTLGADGIAGTADDNLHLQPNSPGVDQGSSDTSVYFLLPEDYDGNPRIENVIDIGAYEWSNCSKTISPAVGGKDTTLCGPYLTALLNSTLPSNGTGRWSLASGTGTIDSMYSNHASISGMREGITQVVWTVQYCNNVLADTVTIKVVDAPANPVITAGGPVTFCTGGSVTLQATPGYSAYHWNTGGSNATLVASASRSYAVTVTDTLGCTANSSTSVTVTVNSNPSKPVITYNGDSILCGNQNVTLHAPVGFSAYLWNTGATLSTITVTGAGAYSVQVRNANGCWSVFSDSVHILQFTNPVKPALTLSDSNVFCSGDSVTVSAPPGYKAYSWNNGSQLPTVTLYNTYDIAVMVTDSNGCASPYSDTVHVQKTVLTAPAITVAGSNSLCLGDSAVLAGPSGYTSYRWSTGDSSRSITVRTAGNYNLQVFNSMGCASPSSANTNIAVHNPPPQPGISAGGPTTFCDGQNVVLSVPSGYNSYQWSNGINNYQTLVSTAGSYSVRVQNSFGCWSPFSSTVQVVVNAIPPTPTITASGATAFCPGDSVVISAPAGYSAYQWTGNYTSRSITVSAAGSYQVQVTDGNGCVSNLSNTISVSAYTISPAPVITAYPSDSVCMGDTIVLTASGSYPEYYWSNGRTGAQIKLTIGATLFVYGVDGNGCNTSNSDSVNVIFKNHPVTPVITLQNQDISTAALAEHYYWLLNDSAIHVDAAEFSSSAMGSYRLFTDSNGCYSDTSNTVTIECAVAAASEISLTPNPGDGNVSLRIAGYKNATITAALFDLMGQKVSNTYNLTVDQCAVSQKNFDFTEVAAGIYFLRLKINDQSVKITWVKMR